MILHDYFRSSASYRVRIALALKGLEVERRAIGLLDREQCSPEFRALSPQQLVPALEVERGVLGQSLAIIEYLEEVYPERSLLAEDPWTRAQQRAMAQVIACDVHPLNNLRVLQHLRSLGQGEEEERRAWMIRWMHPGFEALEVMASDRPFLGGERPMLPDLVLVPQMYNARRFSVPLEAFPRLNAITERCEALPEFQAASPETVGPG